MRRLENKAGLVAGVANDQSIAAGCVRALHDEGASLALTYRNENAAPYARPIADAVDAAIIMPLDVRREEEMDALFAAIEQQWGRLDFLIHCIAFCGQGDLRGRMIDSSREGFAEAMDISCHSFIRMARRAEPLMTNGGGIVTVSFIGAEKVVANYGVMGPVKAALESSVRYLAAELGPKGIRVNALSPGPIKTRAASGLADFASLIRAAERAAPLPALATIDDVGAYAAFLVSDAARAVTGSVVYVDAGYNIMNGIAHGDD